MRTALVALLVLACVASVLAHARNSPTPVGSHSRSHSGNSRSGSRAGSHGGSHSGGSHGGSHSGGSHGGSHSGSHHGSHSGSHHGSHSQSGSDHYACSATQLCSQSPQHKGECCSRNGQCSKSAFACDKNKGCLSECDDSVVQQAEASQGSQPTHVVPGGSASGSDGSAAASSVIVKTVSNAVPLCTTGNCGSGSGSGSASAASQVAGSQSGQSVIAPFMGSQVTPTTGSQAVNSMGLPISQQGVPISQQSASAAAVSTAVSAIGSQSALASQSIANAASEASASVNAVISSASAEAAKLISQAEAAAARLRKINCLKKGNCRKQPPKVMTPERPASAGDTMEASLKDRIDHAMALKEQFGMDF